MRAVVTRVISASVSIDGGFMEALTFRATYNRAVEYTFRASGGHAFGAFGTVPNPVGAAARAVAKLNEIRVPEAPKTTYAASTIHSDEDSGITAIPESCRLTVNFRSDGEQEFRWLAGELDRDLRSGYRQQSVNYGRTRTRRFSPCFWMCIANALCNLCACFGSGRGQNCYYC